MSASAMRVWTLVLGLWTLVPQLLGCAASASSALPRAESSEAALRWHYDVHVNADLRSLDATICFEGATPRELRAGKDEAAPRLLQARWISPGPVRPLAIKRGRIQLGRAAPNGCVAYQIDLREGGSLGAAVRRVGSSVLASPNVWLWRPERRAQGARATLKLALKGGVNASLPWPVARDGARFELDANAFAFDSHAAFGKLGLVTGEHLGVPFEAAALDASLTPDSSTIAKWMKRAVELASLGPGGFPASRMHVILLPAATEGEPVAFGSVTRGGAGSVLLFVSPRATLVELERDWVLPHELSHLFLPYVSRQHAWFSEGAATYYQEVLRARGGVIAESEALLNIARSTRSAALDGTGRALREESLAMHETYAFRAVYWAGAAFFLMADVAVRRGTQGQASLDSVLSSLRADGPADLGESLDELLMRMDRHVGEPIFKPLAEVCLARPFPDLEPVLRELGVVGDGDDVSISASATLAEIRTTIFGARPTAPAPKLTP